MMTNLSGPLTERHVRLLKISIAVMTVLLVAGLFALFYGMTRQGARISSARSDSAPQPFETRTNSPYKTRLDLEAGQLISVTPDGDRIILHIRGKTGDSLAIVSIRDGREVGQIQVPSN